MSVREERERFGGESEEGGGGRIAVRFEREKREG